MLSFSTFSMSDSPSEVCQYLKYSSLQIAHTQIRYEWLREMSKKKQQTEDGRGEEGRNWKEKWKTSSQSAQIWG